MWRQRRTHNKLLWTHTGEHTPHTLHTLRKIMDAKWFFRRRPGSSKHHQQLEELCVLCGSLKVLRVYWSCLVWQQVVT